MVRPKRQDVRPVQQDHELPDAVHVLPERPEEPEAEAAEKKEVLRRVYIRQTDLDAHGYTATCTACDLIRGDSFGILPSSSSQQAAMEESAEGRKRSEAPKRKDPP